jgi:hypothetical protein
MDDKNSIYKQKFLKKKYTGGVWAPSLFEAVKKNNSPFFF